MACPLRSSTAADPIGHEMSTAGQFIAELQRERRSGNVSSETEQHLKHEFRTLGRDASDSTLAAAVGVEIDRLKQRGSDASQAPRCSVWRRAARGRHCPPWITITLTAARVIQMMARWHCWCRRNAHPHRLTHGPRTVSNGRRPSDLGDQSTVGGALPEIVVPNMERRSMRGGIRTVHRRWDGRWLGSASASRRLSPYHGPCAQERVGIPSPGGEGAGTDGQAPKRGRHRRRRSRIRGTHRPRPGVHGLGRGPPEAERREDTGQQGLEGYSGGFQQRS